MTNCRVSNGTGMNRFKLSLLDRDSCCNTLARGNGLVSTTTSLITGNRMRTTLRMSMGNVPHHNTTTDSILFLGPACTAISHCNMVTYTYSNRRVNIATGAPRGVTRVLSIVTNRSTGSNADLPARGCGCGIGRGVRNGGTYVIGRLLRNMDTRIGSRVSTCIGRLGSGNIRVARVSVGRFSLLGAV